MDVIILFKYHHIKKELEEKGSILAADNCDDEDTDECNDLKKSLLKLPKSKHDHGCFLGSWGRNLFCEAHNSSGLFITPLSQPPDHFCYVMRIKFLSGEQCPRSLESNWRRRVGAVRSPRLLVTIALMIFGFCSLG